MAYYTRDGQYIITAGEISAYTVCPEQWRLTYLESATKSKDSNVKKGKELHRDWADKYDESIFLARSVRLIFMLILIAIGLFLIVIK